MFKRVIGLQGVALLIALVAHAGDAWKDKSFKDWDQKDVQKILSDSPWVKPIDMGGGGGGSSSSSLTPTGDAAHRDLSQGANGGSDAGGGGGGPQLKFTICWASSRTFREAIARNKELQGTSPEEAEKNLSMPQETYLILVRGNNLSGLDKEGEASLKEKAYLMGKKSKEKVPPSKVMIQKGQDGRRTLAVIFEFPKKTASGEQVIGTDEKGVEFYTPGTNASLKVGFDLAKMADKQGNDW